MTAEAGAGCCYGCRCHSCVLSCDLQYRRKPGEITEADEVCFNCDDCRNWDGDPGKRVQWRDECQRYRAARSYIEARNEAEKTKRRYEDRKKSKGLGFRVIRGGKSGK